MAERITLVVGGFDALAAALRPAPCFDQVIAINTTSELRAVITGNQIPKNDPSRVVFVFADTLVVDTPQDLSYLVSQLTAMNWKVLITELSPQAIDLVRANPKAGFLQGPFRVNDVIYAISNLNTAAGVIPPYEQGYTLIDYNQSSWSSSVPAPDSTDGPYQAPSPRADTTAGGWTRAAPEAPLAPPAPAPAAPPPAPPAPTWSPPAPVAPPAPPAPAWDPPAPASAPVSPPPAPFSSTPPRSAVPSAPPAAPYYPAGAGGRTLQPREGALPRPPVTSSGTYDDFRPQLSNQRRARVITVASPKGGTGKALSLDEVVPTPNGWARFGDLAVGDALFDERGDVCRVTALSEVWNHRTCYQLEFSDGTSIVADAAHEWPTWYGPTKKTILRTTEEIAASLVKRVRDLPLANAKGPAIEMRHAIVNPDPLSLPEVRLPIDPYVLGAWLGDGTSAQGSITSADPQIAEEIRGAGYEVRSHHYGTSAASRLSVIGLKVQLAQLGVLGNKHIPPLYLRSSFKQRLSLLQGLMDTDGSTDRRQAGCEFTTVTPALRDGMLELVRSLGVSIKVTEARAMLNGIDCGPKWRLRFSVPSDISPFRLERKSVLVQPLQSTVLRRQIVSCNLVGQMDTRCIEVDSPSHLFLAGLGMVPTHNSTLTLNLAVYLGLRLRKFNKRVCIIDANFQQADAGKLLDKYSPNIVSLSKDRSAIVPEQIERYLIHRPDLNISALLGPAIPSEANPALFTGALYNTILEALRPNFDYIFIDTPVAEIYHDIFKNFALPQSDFIIVPITPAYHTIMNADAWLSTITQPTHANGEGIDPAIIGIVMNQQRDNVGITEDEVRQELFHWKYLGSIPDTNEWVRALNNNELIATKNIHELNVAFGRILYEATGEQEMLYGIDLGSAGSDRPSILSRFRRRR